MQIGIMMRYQCENELRYIFNDLFKELTYYYTAVKNSKKKIKTNENKWTTSEKKKSAFYVLERDCCYLMKKPLSSMLWKKDFCQMRTTINIWQTLFFNTLRKVKKKIK